MSLHIEIEHAGKAASVTVQGDVTIQTSPELRNELQPLFTSDVEVIKIKLDGVGFMDSSGIATLVEGLQWSKRVGGRFVLLGLSETVRDVFELAKLDTIFEIEG
ncbi:MAG: STAS domain-containing protein [Ghiorsea sp.]|nr:STAS domain-containing protein [Ghiorsea sp.]